MGADDGTTQLDQLNTFSVEAETDKVCVPIIGKFSTGKSALCNTLLMVEDFLTENVTPETPIPTELVYTSQSEKECLTIYYKDGSMQEYPPTEEIEPDMETAKARRYTWKNDFLGEIPTVMLVDMPGFDSDIEAHNNMIDGYVGKSMYYLVAFSAEDMIVHESLGETLRELCGAHDMDICVVITKCDKVTRAILEDGEAHIREVLEKYIGDKSYEICRTSALDGYVETLKKRLHKIEDDAQGYLDKKHTEQLKGYALPVVSYLKSRIAKAGMTESQLAEQKEQYQQELETFAQEQKKHTAEFDRDIFNCIQNIKGDVRNALVSQTSSLAHAAVKGEDIQEPINSTIRTAVMESYKKHYSPVIERYLNRVSDSFAPFAYQANVASVSGGDGDALGGVATVGMMAGAAAMAPTVAGMVATATPALLASLGTAGASAVAAGTTAMAFLSAVPVVGVILAGVTGIGALIGREKKKQEALEQAKAAVRSQVIPNVMAGLEPHLDADLKKQSDALKKEVDQSVTAQLEAMKKAIEDAEVAFQKEQGDNAQELETMETYLNQVEGILHG